MNLIPWKRKNANTSEMSKAVSPVSRLRQDMDSLFDRFMTDPWSLSEDFSPFAGGGLAGWGGIPRVDMSESDKEITITAEIPGVRAEDLDIRVCHGTLQIRGEHKQESEDKNRDYHCIERQHGAFERSIPIPSYADTESIEATCKDGVLKVTIAKNPEFSAKRVTVKSA